MWIVDDEGDMFNTDHYECIQFSKENRIMLICNGMNCYEFKLSKDLTPDERLTRYYDLVEKLTGVRIDE